jgi:hypothetical protein
MMPVWLTGLAALGLFVGLASLLAPLQPNILALQFAFTPAAFARVVHAWPDAHRQLYLDHLRWDWLLLSFYAAFGWLLATRSTLFVAEKPGLRRVAKWLLPAAALCDGIENALHAWLVPVPRFGMGWLYAVAATSSSLKWLLLLSFAALAVKALARGGD